jgi:hypothetical protein
MNKPILIETNDYTETIRNLAASGLTIRIRNARIHTRENTSSSITHMILDQQPRAGYQTITLVLGVQTNRPY